MVPLVTGSNQTRVFNNKTKNTWWTVDSPEKIFKKPKFQPSIQGACEGITQTVCDGNLRGSSVRYRFAGVSMKNPWRLPSPQIILKARNPVWSGGRVEKIQVACACTRARMNVHACMVRTYVRSDLPSYLHMRCITSHMNHTSHIATYT